MEIVLFLLIIVVLDVVAMRWGANSSDKIDSPEWERRRRWRCCD